MSLGDFSSVVQLGVGLHAGTALLQTISEFASAPMSRKLQRLKAIAETRARRDKSAEEHVETACDLVGDLEVKKIQFFNEYRKVVAVNTGVAIALCLLLTIIAFNASQDLSPWIAYPIVFASLLPAPASMLLLWNRWTTHTASTKAAMDNLNAALLGSG